MSALGHRTVHRKKQRCCGLLLTQNHIRIKDLGAYMSKTQLSRHGGDSRSKHSRSGSINCRGAWEMALLEPRKLSNGSGYGSGQKNLKAGYRNNKNNCLSKGHADSVRPPKQNHSPLTENQETGSSNVFIVSAKFQRQSERNPRGKREHVRSSKRELATDQK